MTEPAALHLPHLVLEAGTELGEGPVWDHDRACLLFVDIMRGHIHQFHPRTGAHRVVEVGQPVGAVAPTVRGDWVAAAKDGFVRVDPSSGRSTLIAAVEADMPANRMNDGYVDARGRFWAGTMDMTETGPTGSLYRLDPDGSVHHVLAGATISNGVDWSPDGRRMYYIDTPTDRVDVLDFDADSGAVSNRRPFAVIPAQPGAGHPDGLVVDAEGHVWVGMWGGGALRRYAPDGALVRVVPFPVSRVTKCAFGGDDLGDLYATTAFIGMDAAARAREPQAGGLFRLRPGVRGRPPHRFGG